ncbi:CDP-alcohol phosphatidyltransferase family protein [Terricaulis silvestris]|uniref:CDP-alcohol phosphatidyltransferase n=1 Tax=Terricaulis silvestris TaxID=2686094 RepID=A0A6I6MMJ7_9CAUL|nr:CDP-alcohol phosphatidyltransferase family protein [Terricaulis silvestris]QGZ95909.1 CDP-alcohol phosphatidyltransferase [Terricaulis silvestris]
MVVEENRRPISQRERGWAKWLARVLVKSGASPNFISFSSIVFAALAGLCFYAIGIATSAGDRVMLCLGAALFCQLRLLANMMDGMVAVEAGKGGPDGPVWNELPDRFADIFILVGAGYGVTALGLADASLGWAAAVAAVMTAYAREVARGAGAPADFSGPMAKPHRMFWMTMAALLTIFDRQIGGALIEAAFTGDRGADGEGAFILLALWLVVVGATVTALNRTRRALAFLNRK